MICAPPNLPSWIDVPILSIFKQKFGVPVFLDNDANAGACAEYLFGAGRGCKHMVFMTFGTGISAGIIIDGNIYRGANCYAGEVGHIRLEKVGRVGVHKAGSFEGFCSGGGIVQLAKQELLTWKNPTTLTESVTAKAVGDAAKMGDALAIRILEISGHHLGLGLAYIIDILNPERIVIGSNFPRCQQFLRPAMEEVLKLEALPQALSACEIVGSELREQISDSACLSVALLALGK